MHSSKGTKLKLYTPMVRSSILFQFYGVASLFLASSEQFFFKKKLGAAGACTMLFATYIN